MKILLKDPGRLTRTLQGANSLNSGQIRYLELPASILAELLVFEAPQHASHSTGSVNVSSYFELFVFCASAVFSSEWHVHFATLRVGMAFSFSGATYIIRYLPHPTLVYSTGQPLTAKNTEVQNTHTHTKQFEVTRNVY